MSGKYDCWHCGANQLKMEELDDECDMLEKQRDALRDALKGMLEQFWATTGVEPQNRAIRNAKSALSRGDETGNVRKEAHR